MFLRTFFDAAECNAILSELHSGQESWMFEDDVAVLHNTHVDPAVAVGPEARRMMALARRSHMQLRINDELTTTITNSVHCTRLIDTRTGLPYRLPLNMLARELAPLGAQYTTQRFAKIVIRYGPKLRVTQLCFATGNVLEAGKVAFDTKRALLYALVDMMRAAGLTTIGVGTRACQNLVSTGMLTFGLRLRLLQMRHSDGNHVVYDPDLFPGAIIRHPLLIDLLAEDEEEENKNVHGAIDSDAGDIASSTALPSYTSNGTSYVYPGPRDCNDDEVLDNPEAARAATEYARAVMERLGADTNDTQRVQAIADEVLSAQAKKNIVALAFEVGCVIIGGTKNVRMLRRAHAIVFEMLTTCRDTPENRALETALLRERGLPVPGEAKTPSTARPHRGRQSGVGAKRKRSSGPGHAGGTRRAKRDADIDAARIH